MDNEIDRRIEAASKASVDAISQISVAPTTSQEAFSGYLSALRASQSDAERDMHVGHREDNLKRSNAAHKSQVAVFVEACRARYQSMLAGETAEREERLHAQQQEILKVQKELIEAQKVELKNNNELQKAIHLTQRESSRESTKIATKMMVLGVGMFVFAAISTVTAAYQVTRKSDPPQLRIEVTPAKNMPTPTPTASGSASEAPGFLGPVYINLEPPGAPPATDPTLTSRLTRSI